MDGSNKFIPNTAEELTVALNGEWKGESGVACCPAHDDKTPSLSIREGKTQSIIFKCHAGCSQDKIIDALRERELIEAPNGNFVDEGSVQKNPNPGPKDQWVSSHPKDAPTPPFPIMTTERWENMWSYTDEANNSSFFIFRFDKDDGSKEIKPLTLWRDQTGKLTWRWKAPPSPKPLYNLGSLLIDIAKTVLVVEGEKSADAAIALFPAHVVTTWPGGSSAVAKANWDVLKDRDVIIWPDNDVPGKEAAQKVAEKALTVGAKNASIVELPDDLPSGWDVADPLPNNYELGWLTERLLATKQPDLPLDIFGDDQIMGKPALSIYHVPSTVYDFAVDTAERIGVDPIVVAAPCIVVAASAIPDSIKVQPKLNDDKWLESARLWMALVAEPGFKKSPVLKEVVKPLRDVENEWAKADQLSTTSYKLSKAIYDDDLKAYRDQRKKKKTKKDDNGVETPSHQNVNIPPIEPKKPAIRRKVVNDTTVEALADTCAQNPGGVLLYVDELSQWVGSLDAYRSGGKASRDQSYFLSAYNGETVRVDRKTHEPLTVENFSVSMLGGIQPGPMSRIASKMTDSGLISRFLVVHGDISTKGLDRVPNKIACDMYSKVITKLAEMPWQKLVIRLNPEAYKTREAFQDRLELMLRDPRTPKTLKHHFRKLDGIVVRVALTFHMIEWAAGNLHPVPLSITGATMRMATSLLDDVLLPNAYKFYRETLGVEQEKDAKWIAGHILAHGLAKITIRDIGRVCHHLLNDKSAIKAAMSTLEIAGWVTPIVKPGRGNDITQWEVTETAHAIYRRRAEIEAADRGQAVRDIREKVAAAKSSEDKSDGDT